MPAVTSSAYLEKLNPEQRAAVAHGDDGDARPLLVIAGAGSGKTGTLANRVAHRLVLGADPRRMLLMTFSRRAAAEMVQRVERIVRTMLGDKAETLVAALTWSGTFHSIGARLLREFAEQIGLDPNFNIHDREDSADLMNLARQELGLTQTQDRFPTKSTCLAIYSACVNTEAELEDVLAASFPWCAKWEEALKQLFGAYVTAKQAQGVLDYDDLLLYWSQMLIDPEIAAEISGRFDDVMVDEYQDTNRLQVSIVMGLSPTGRGLTVVGDDCQGIYSFRGADPSGILRFPTMFDPPARIVMLERNYRSTQPILAASNGVIALAAERYAKTLWTDKASAQLPRLITVRDEGDQARYVVEQVLEARERGLTLKQQCILFRTSSHSATLELELTRRNIPFVKFGGLKFLDSAHVKDLLALLRFVENPRDRVAGFRVMLLLPGVGPATAQRALDRMGAASDPFGALGDTPVPPRIDGSVWGEFVDIAQGLHLRRHGWPAEVEAARLWYTPHLERAYEDAVPRAADLVQLEAIAAGYPSRERFLTELTLDPPDATSDQAGVPMLDDDYLNLSTIHSAKGREFRSVFVLNAVDGCIPSDLGTGSTRELEEERRLLYVGMTRAMDDLHVLVPHRFFTHGQAALGDRHVYASRTRFIPPELLPLFERLSWPVVPALSMAAASMAAGRPKVDIAARMRGMWS